MKRETTPVLKDDLTFREYMDQQKLEVDRHLNQVLPPVDTHPEVIHEAIRYSVFPGGKRIRPILALSTGEAVEGDLEKLMTLASVLEMIHTYSLIHDDLPAMDNDDYRRGKPSTHKKFGEAIALLAGNGLLILAFQQLAALPARGEEMEAKVAVLNQLCRAIGTTQGMLAGQVLDLVEQGRPYTAQQLEQVHSAKTGALIQASVYCAALLSESSEETCSKLSSFGRKIGLAFQIVDDILDSSQDSNKFPATYPALYGLEASQKMAVELVEEAIHDIEFLGSRGETLTELARFISVRRF